MLLLASAFATPVASVEQKVLFGEGRLTADIMIDIIGEVPETVDLTAYTSEGNIEYVLTWEEFTEWLEMTSVGHAPETDASIGIPLTSVPPHYDTGRGLPGSQSWFCDDSSAWIAYSGASGGASIATANSAGPTGGTICGGWYGPEEDWIDVTMVPDLITLNGGSVSYEGCYADEWDNQANGYCDGSFSPGVFNVMRISGPGALYTVGSGGFGFDYFLGNQAEMTRI